MLSKVLSLHKLSCPQIWNIEREKDGEKERVGGRPAKLNENKGRQRSRVRDRKQRRNFLLEEQHDYFVAAVGLNSLMDRALPSVIAKVRVRFPVTFQPLRFLIQMQGSLPLSLEDSCRTLISRPLTLISPSPRMSIRESK